MCGMSAYTFNHFMRDYRNVGKVSPPLRMVAWMSGMRLTQLDEINAAVAECSLVVDAVGAAMTPAERANPRSLLESRRMEIADAANVSDRELSSLLDAYEYFVESAPMRRRQWWEEMSIHALFWGLPVLFIALLVGLVLLILNTL
jgi:signal recognition particle GTPase